MNYTINNNSSYSILFVREEASAYNSQGNVFNDIFKTLKEYNNKLFIPVINLVFRTNYSMDEIVTLCPTEGNFIVDNKKGTSTITERVSDFLIQIGSKRYLLECQSLDDSTMVIRMVEYTFLAALKYSHFINDELIITMPDYSIIYLRGTKSTPRETKLRYNFPNGDSVSYSSPNIVLSDLSKEDIVVNKLFVLIPFYLLRYENIIKGGQSDISKIEQDLIFFEKALSRECEDGIIKSNDNISLRHMTNTVISHLYNNIDDNDGNRERLVKVMGGTSIIIPENLIFMEGKAEGLAEGLAEGMIEALEQIKRATQLINDGTCSTKDELLHYGIESNIAEYIISNSK